MRVFAYKKLKAILDLETIVCLMRTLLYGEIEIHATQCQWDRNQCKTRSSEDEYSTGSKINLIVPTGQWYALSAVINDAWYWMVLDGIIWYCIVLHGIAWYCTVLHGTTWYCMILHVIARYCMVLQGVAWYYMVL